MFAATKRYLEMKRAEEDTSFQLKRHKTAVDSAGSAQPHMANGGTSSSSSAEDASFVWTYLNDVIETLNGKNGKFDEFLEAMDDYKTERIDITGLIARIEELFKGHPNLIMGFNTILHQKFEITLPEEPAAKKPVEFSDANNFVIKVKIRLRGDDHVYKSFLDILNLYRREPKCAEEVYHEVAVLFEDHIDLLGEFRNFFPDTSRTAYARNLDRKDKSVASNADQHFTADYSNPNCDKSLMSANMDLQMCEENEDMREPKRGYDHNDGRSLNYTNSVSKSETDDKCAPGKIATGSEVYTAKQILKFQECLFQCEDDRIELDVLLCNVITAIKCIEDLLEKMKNNNNQIDTPFGIEEYIPALSLQCIERLYGNHGLDLIDALKKNPTYVLPFILIRLKQKQEEWSRCRDDFNEVWNQVYAENHLKIS